MLKEEKKKVLMISYPFPPLASSGVHRTIRFVRYLRDFGWEPIVLTIRDAHAKDYIPRDSSLVAKIPTGIRITRTTSFDPLATFIAFKNRGGGRHIQELPQNGKETQPHNPSLMKRLLERILNFLYLPDDCIGWLYPAYKAASRLLQSEHIDAIYTTGNPWTAHLIGVTLKQMFGKPWLADFRDPWANNPWRQHRPTVRQAVERFMELQVIKNADRVIANTDYLKKDFISRYENLREKFVTITNGYDPGDFKKQAETQPNSKYRITHTGRFYNRRNPYPFLHALSELLATKQIDADHIEVRFIGKDFINVGQLIQSMQLAGQVKISGDKPHRDCIAEMYAADLLLLIEPDSTVQIPAKFFEYAATGKPILGIAKKSSATAEFIKDYGLGVVADPDDVEAIKSHLLALASCDSNTKTRTVRTDVLHQFDGKKLTGLLADVLQSVVRPN